MRAASDPHVSIFSSTSTRMEVVSIAATAFNLAKTGGQIALYISRTNKSDAAIETLCKEINNLSAVLYSIHQEIPKVTGNAIRTRTGEIHWKNVERSLKDCQETLINLDNLVKGIKKTKGFFRKPR